MKSHVVTCRGVKKDYGSEASLVHALRGVELEARAGELLMLVGPSGCGKTTLLSIITGILHQDSGSCKVFDEEINHLTEREKTLFRKNHIGFVFQTLHLIPSITAIENVMIPLILNEVDKEEAYDRSVKMLTRMGLAHRIDALPSHMSGGEQQRVAICRSCVHEPQLIVCDEPTSTLDHETGSEVMKLMRELVVNESNTLIVVTHDTRIYGFADRILRMDDGEIIGELKNSH